MAGSFLFLQGPATRFFARLGAALRARGHAVRRVNFNGGDRLFWPLPGAVDYRGDRAGWPRFIEDRLSAWHVTDLVLFGDCRPLHRAAIDVARALGVRVHVFEEGYLRPNWITLEAGGVNGHSALPRDPRWYRAAAAACPPWSDGAPVAAQFAARALQDVAYTAAAILLWPRFRRYRRHQPLHPLMEYAGWARRTLRDRLVERRRTAAAMAALAAAGRPYFLLPLQLDSDSQIRDHSPFADVAEFVDVVIRSFAAHPPGDTLLIAKEHPLDYGPRLWRPLIRACARRAGVEDRVVHLAGGDLERLVAEARGVVTVNSTSGSRALARGVPLIALGHAIYALDGLTFQGPLDAFWTAAQPPDPALFDALRRVLAARCLVNGGFYGSAAIARAVAACVARLEAAREHEAVREADGAVATNRPRRAQLAEVAP